jgi:DNA repair protein RecO (recombination protein O)
MVDRPTRGDRTPAIILSTRPLGDADLLVVVLTAGAGKVRAAARNARRSRRRFAGGLPGGAMGQATLVPGRSGLWRLEAFEMLRPLDQLGRDLDRFAYVAYLCELTDALVQEPEHNPPLFASLSEAIGAVLDRGPSPAILRRHELVLLRTLGLVPAFELCCVCGARVSGDSADRPVRFDAERGGVLCPIHAGAAETIPGEVIAVARALLEAEPGGEAEVMRLLEAAEAETRRTLRDLTTGLVRAQLRRPLRSLEFFAKLGRAAGDP